MEEIVIVGAARTAIGKFGGSLAKTPASDLGALGMDLVMETGQESAPELLQFLNDLRCKNVKVNFDPANMILYGAGDPDAKRRSWNGPTRSPMMSVGGRKRSTRSATRTRMTFGATIRGGTGVIYNNTYGGTVPTGWYGITLMVYRACGGDTSAWQVCNGTNWEIGSTNFSTNC